MSHMIELSDRAERAITTVATEQGMTPEEYIARFIEAWARRLTDEPHDPDQAWYWTPEWQAGECAADADHAAGRSVFYESDEAFLEALEKRIGDPTEDLSDADS